MSFLRSINNFDFHSVKDVGFRAKESVFAGNFTAQLIQKKSAVKAHQLLVETYDDHPLSETTYKNWFRRFKNNDFDVEDKERSGSPKKFENEELEALLHEDSCQAPAELAESLGVDHTVVSKRLNIFGMIQKASTLNAVRVEA